MSSSARPEPATANLEPEKTDVGSVFVSNYPPYSAWTEDDLEAARQALDAPARAGADLGLYMHIPFCRRRCKFCYFRVYTDKNARDIQGYLENLVREIEIYSQKPAVRGRPLRFIYFGGGTPSYISAKHLRATVDKIKRHLPWESAQEVAFECEPGTLTQSKVEAIRDIGVTRVSLGVEHFNDDILKENGRAHQSQEIYRCWPWIQEKGFDQVNIDLIAGMVGESWDTWKEAVEKAIELSPDSVTIYQMELPFNTTYSSHILKGQEIEVADWETKRDWHQYAVEQLTSNGYRISSAYTLLKEDQQASFVYRDSVWQGADMMGTGVSAFGHMSGVHIQNEAGWEQYQQALEEGQLPWKRAFKTAPGQRLIREMILQLKLGRLATDYFKQKFDTDIIDRFRPAFESLRQADMLDFDDEVIQLTTKGLLRVDQLLPKFYEEKYQGARYT
ncbi:MAG TPA: coproporphyrinogen-III oxidase family protein [Acidobacteriota bacterium]|nr:coproporphyrinogen-III oxidase family protein [Acidobacteriota bacterium]